MSEAYARSGVDVTAGYESVRLMRRHVESTFTPGVLGSIGGFGGMFQPDLSGIQEPVLVSGSDGVGTKLKIAFIMDKHDTVGIDCVAMCVNDVICAGARPLFFLDYIACGKNRPEKIAAIVGGVAAGCKEAGCALIGGETAEMPGFYPEDEYDIAGFSTAIVDKGKIIDGSKVMAGYPVIGVASSGVHSNGFSLIRKVLDVSAEGLSTHVPELGHSLGEELIRPTKIYVRGVLELQKSVDVLAVSHITGGGFYENLPRMLPQGFGIIMDSKKIPKLPIFDLIAKTGSISYHDMCSTFNMGLGLAIIVKPEDGDRAVGILRDLGYKASIVGAVSTDGEIRID